MNLEKIAGSIRNNPHILEKSLSYFSAYIDKTNLDYWDNSFSNYPIISVNFLLVNGLKPDTVLRYHQRKKIPRKYRRLFSNIYELGMPVDPRHLERFGGNIRIFHLIDKTLVMSF